MWPTCPLNTACDRIQGDWENIQITYLLDTNSYFESHDKFLSASFYTPMLEGWGRWAPHRPTYKGTICRLAKFLISDLTIVFCTFLAKGLHPVGGRPGGATVSSSRVLPTYSLAFCATWIRNTAFRALGALTVSRPALPGKQLTIKRTISDGNFPNFFLLFLCRLKLPNHYNFIVIKNCSFRLLFKNQPSQHSLGVFICSQERLGGAVSLGLTARQSLTLPNMSDTCFPLPSCNLPAFSNAVEPVVGRTEVPAAALLADVATDVISI